MACDKLVSLTGCNSCVFKLTDDTLLTTIRAEAIIRLCLYITQNKIMTTQLLDCTKTTISCSGRLLVSGNEPDTDSEYNIFKHNVSVCSLIIDRWSDKHESYMSSTIGQVIRDISVKINYISNLSTLHAYLIKSVKDIRDVTVCNGVCSKIATTKEISNCSFRLLDNKIISALNDPRVILRILIKAVYAHVVSSKRRAYLDISQISMKCNGVIELPSELSYSSDPTGPLLNKCVEMLRMWYNTHKKDYRAHHILTVINLCTTVKCSRDLYQCLHEGMRLIKT